MEITECVLLDFVYIRVSLSLSLSLSLCFVSPSVLVPAVVKLAGPLYRMMDLLSIRLSRADKFQGNLVARHG